MTETTELNLESFFPSNALQLTKIVENEDVIRIHLKYVTTSFECPQCQVLSNQYHGTHQRTVQNLPILGKSVQLKIRAHEYHCSNPDCSVTTFSENFACF